VPFRRIAHGAQFDTPESSSDCARCHAIATDWPIAKFDHDSTQFILEGRHAQIKCDAYHKPEENSDIIIYKIKRFDCIDCHS